MHVQSYAVEITLISTTYLRLTRLQQCLSMVTSLLHKTHGLEKTPLDETKESLTNTAHKHKPVLAELIIKTPLMATLKQNAIHTVERSVVCSRSRADPRAVRHHVSSGADLKDHAKNHLC